MSLIVYDLGSLQFPDYTTTELPTISNIKKGDTINFSGTLIDFDSTPIDSTDWLIRAELYDDTNSIRRGSVLVTDGGTDQAEWTSPTEGKFQIYFWHSTTSIFTSNANLEIEIETGISGEKLTIYQGIVEFADTRINWNDSILP